MRPMTPVNNTDAHLAQISNQLDELIGILRPAPPAEPEPEPEPPADAPADDKPAAKKAAPAKKAATRKRVTGQ